MFFVTVADAVNDDGRDKAGLLGLTFQVESFNEAVELLSRLDASRGIKLRLRQKDRQGAAEGIANNDGRIQGFSRVLECSFDGHGWAFRVVGGQS